MKNFIKISLEKKETEKKKEGKRKIKQICDKHSTLAVASTFRVRGRSLSLPLEYAFHEKSKLCHHYNSVFEIAENWGSATRLLRKSNAHH